MERLESSVFLFFLLFFIPAIYVSIYVSLFCFSHIQVQSAGHVPSTALSLCSGWSLSHIYNENLPLNHAIEHVSSLYTPCVFFEIGSLTGLGLGAGRSEWAGWLARELSLPPAHTSLVLRLHVAACLH